MLKKYLLALLLLPATIVTAKDSNSHTAVLSATTRKYLHDAATHPMGKPMEGYVYKQINGVLYVSAFIKVSADVHEGDLTGLGVHVGTKAGHVWTVQIPTTQMTSFTKVPGIQNIDVDLPISPMNDAARKATRADSAQRGINLPLPLTGHNVVVGVIDAGFDYDHPTFYDTLHSMYRVRRVWAQKRPGTPPMGFAYGAEMTDPYLIRAVGYDTAITTHGTHVAGIAAGSGYGSPGNNKYRGMAYDAELVFVGIMPAPNQWAAGGSTDIIDGIAYIFNYASSVFKPCIVNLSWGSSLGPHDGLSLFSQACDALTGPGKIFACSAGNSGGDTLHLQKTFTTASPSVSTFITFDPSLDSANQKTWIDIWGDTAKSFCLNVKLYNGATASDSTLNICMADTSHTYTLLGSDGRPVTVSVTLIPSEYNGKPHGLVYFHSFTNNNICLTATGTSGTINIWTGYVHPPVGYYGAFKKLGYPFAVSGDTRMTVSDYTSSRTALGVGAYVSKASFTNINGAALSYPGAINGRIAPFSSLGPLPDGRVKPDITGPGMALASAVSSFDTSYGPTGDNYIAVINNTTIGGRTYPYAMAAGTSMSCPATSGIVAMMLQMNSTLTPDSVKNILARTAIKDANTGTIPAGGSNTWGSGKVNAYAALRNMAAQVMVKNALSPNPMDCLLYPNPNTGNFSVLLNNAGATSVTIKIFDISGKQVYYKQQPVSNGQNKIEVSLQGLKAGLYLTHISDGMKENVVKTMIK
jgi:hypothetical protein